MRIIKGLFLGVLIGFLAGCCLREHYPVIERSQNTISLLASVVKFTRTGDDWVCVESSGVEQGISQRFMLCSEENSPGAAWAMPPLPSRSSFFSSLSESISVDIAAGNYKKPYEYLRNRRAGVDNTLYFSWRYGRFSDEDRRGILNVYLKKLHEAGYDDWLGKIHVREREDYYNAILARLRCLYIMLETLHTQGRDDVFFSQVWREFDFLGRRLDNLLGISEEFFRNETLGLSEKERVSIQLDPMMLPVPEILPTWEEKMRLE